MYLQKPHKMSTIKTISLFIW